MRGSLRERFEEKYVPDPNSGCWIWFASSNSSGYGTIMGPGNKVLMAHRASYELFVGPVPDGLCVLHKCDVPCCVNPDHLFLGTMTDNSIDKSAKGRCFRKQNKLPQGVRRRRNKYSVRLGYEGVVYNGGRLYDTPEEASRRYLELLDAAQRGNLGEEAST